MNEFEVIKGGNHKETSESLDYTKQSSTDKDVLKFTEEIVLDKEIDLSRTQTVAMPIAELASLGGAAAALLPAFRTVHSTISVETGGLYRLANQAVGDTLKVAKNGNFWGAMKTQAGKSKFAQLQEVGTLSASQKTVMPINPATVMIAVAMYSIDQKLDQVMKMQKQILSFLEEEKQSQQEADLKTLTRSLEEYKINWDHQTYINSHYKQTLDIKRNAMKDIISYHKEISQLCKKNAIIVVKKDVKKTEAELLNKFKYYKMAIYTFALSSFLELIFLGEFKEDHLFKVQKELIDNADQYREDFNMCSNYIEKLAESSIEKNVLNGVGNVGKSIGNVIGKIPLVEKGPIDEWLVDAGNHMKNSASGIKMDAIHTLAQMRDSGTWLFIEKVGQINRICNHTSKICFDEKTIYLVTA